jgi:hypothetical protein
MPELPMRRDPAAIRPVFRPLAWVLGPFMILGSVIAPVAIAWSLVWNGGEDWIGWMVVAVFMASCTPLGFRIFQAARTGRDPFAGKTVADLQR